MPEPLDGVASNVGVGMGGKPKTDLLGPDSAGRVEGDDDGNVEQLGRIASGNDRLHVGFRPPVLKRPHLSPRLIPPLPFGTRYSPIFQKTSLRARRSRAITLARPSWSRFFA